MGKKLDAVLTPVSFADMTDVFRCSWMRLLGRAPSNDALAVLLAQSALETGHWKQCYCFNLGNAKAGPSWSGDFCFYPADEIVSAPQAAQAFALRAPRTDGVQGHDAALTPLRSGQVQVTLFPDHPWCRFRAFATLDDGVDDYLDLLHHRFAKAWSAVESGNPDTFVRTLKELGYFTASVERYLPPVVQLFTRFSKALANPATLQPPPAAATLPVSPAARPTLRVGDRSDAVGELQRTLVALGYEGLTETGVYDEGTLQAVELFQLQHIDDQGRPLKSDGVVGKNTWWALLNPSGEAQRSFLSMPRSEGLTEKRKALLAVLAKEHEKAVAEAPDGSNRSADIDRYWGKTGLVGLPWCCAFVSWALHEALGTYPIAGKHHTAVQAMWVAANGAGMGVKEPKPGDVFIQIKSAGTGHTGFVVGVSEDGQTIYTCEGNCGNRLKLGQRPTSFIHHFVDCLADGQSVDFKRGPNLAFADDVSDENTR